MIDKYGAYGFSWREWSWFATLFLSFFAQTVLAFHAYKEWRRLIRFNLHRINHVSHEIIWEKLNPIEDTINLIREDQRKQRNRSWLSG